MEAIKKYFTAWDFARIFKMVLGIALIFGYFSTKEKMYLVGAIFFAGQAILNIGCPGGSCATNVPNDTEKKVMEFEKYEPGKDKKNV
ncbi:MAG TPA: hypothetical protein P5084_13770 [Paludibacter sp.]|nr:hypothetical protein [Paludibacter sp.]